MKGCSAGRINTFVLPYWAHTADLKYSVILQFLCLDHIAHIPAVHHWSAGWKYSSPTTDCIPGLGESSLLPIIGMSFLNTPLWVPAWTEHQVFCLNCCSQQEDLFLELFWHQSAAALPICKTAAAVTRETTRNEKNLCSTPIYACLPLFLNLFLAQAPLLHHSSL